MASCGHTHVHATPACARPQCHTRRQRSTIETRTPQARRPLARMHTPTLARFCATPPHPQIEIRDRDSYIPSTSPYSMGECLRDLLDMAARLLVEGGRLVYFFPANPNGCSKAGRPVAG
eukprot:26529-Chlamydomonas_euryale.AAC.1